MIFLAWRETSLSSIFCRVHLYLRPCICIRIVWSLRQQTSIVTRSMSRSRNVCLRPGNISMQNSWNYIDTRNFSSSSTVIRSILTFLPLVTCDCCSRNEDSCKHRLGDNVHLWFLQDRSAKCNKEEQIMNIAAFWNVTSEDSHLHICRLKNLKCHLNMNSDLRFEIVLAVTLVAVFWAVTPNIPAER
jgi:hypothetical protein